MKPENKGKVMTLRVVLQDDQSDQIWEALKSKDRLVAGCQITAVAWGDTFKERDCYMERWDRACEQLPEEEAEEIEQQHPLPEEDLENYKPRERWKT